MFRGLTDKIRRRSSVVPAAKLDESQTQAGSSQSAPSNQRQSQQYLSPQPIYAQSNSGKEAPPAYIGPSAAAAPATASSPLPSVASVNAKYSVPRDCEDPLEMLRAFDTVFLVDDSSSMQGDRWKQACKSIMGVADIASRYDDDGIDIYFLNNKKVGQGLKGKREVEAIFKNVSPRGATPTGMRLDYIMKNYMKQLEKSQSRHATEEIKPMNLIVVTDGAPTDDPESVIVAHAKRLDKGDYPLSQVGIQFFQVGNDPSASGALEELDDGLSSTHGIRDMVDTVPYNGNDMSTDIIIKTLLGGINRRLDRKGPTV